jgi:hypothetical protein
LVKSTVGLYFFMMDVKEISRGKGDDAMVSLNVKKEKKAN